MGKLSLANARDQFRTIYTLLTPNVCVFDVCDQQDKTAQGRVLLLQYYMSVENANENIFKEVYLVIILYVMILSQFSIKYTLCTH